MRLHAYIECVFSRNVLEHICKLEGKTAPRGTILRKFCNTYSKLEDENRGDRIEIGFFLHETEMDDITKCPFCDDLPDAECRMECVNKIHVFDKRRTEDVEEAICAMKTASKNNMFCVRILEHAPV